MSIASDGGHYLQSDLFAPAEARIDRGAERQEIQLSETSWVHCHRGLVAGADELFAPLRDSVPWRTAERWMYDRRVADPRLSSWQRPGQREPHPLLEELRSLIVERYRHVAAAPSTFRLGGVAFNFYRDGSDSVAFHGDRELRRLDNTIVAVLTIGATRPFRIRPLDGGASVDLAPRSGDLIVMGGSCQATHEHGVPKTARAVGPRISASWRWAEGSARIDDFNDQFFTARTWRRAADDRPKRLESGSELEIQERREITHGDDDQRGREHHREQR